MANRSKCTPRKKQTILAAIGRGLTIGEAAQCAGVSRRAVFDWKAADPVFAREFEDAYQAGTDCYEAEARRRAFDQSDALLIFLLKSRDPQRFARKLLAIGGDPDAPLAIHHTGNDDPSERVHFFLPDNRRHEPEDIEPDDQRTIEGDASEDKAA
jgi:hypothetical protein